MMRLISCTSKGGFDLAIFKHDDDIPPYAILSHTWIDGQEVTYDELIAGISQEKTGYNKLRFCRERVVQDELQYFWVDTCCINKCDFTEFTIAINSMFRWYQRATKCYVYLADVHIPHEVHDVQVFRSTWEGAFRRSRWFTRGWTLQELLAPRIVEFFSKEGKKLGSKISLEREISTITQIPIDALRASSFRDFGIEQRMGWVVKRKTSLAEDKAYCLLGIFGVFLPVIYGEGEDYAFGRLRREVASQAEQLGTPVGMKRAQTLVSSLPFPRNESFVGRDSYLRILEEWFDRSHSYRRISIYGLGGCGKTALALEFSYQILAKRSTYSVFWVPAVSRETFELAYRAIGNLLRISGIQEDNADVKQLVKDRLSSSDVGDWLMIVDNADDANILLAKLDTSCESSRLMDYLPRNNRGSILFTTRNRKTAESLSKFSFLELEDMSKTMAEAKEMINLQISNNALLNDDNAIEELLELLTYLPLAIMQATAFINQNPIAISEYVLLFRDANSEAELFNEHFEDPNRYEEMESTIAKTWYISFNQIRKQDPLAADYLSFMACIDRVNIPLSLLPSKDSAVRRLKAIKTLTGYALIAERGRNLQQPQKEKFFDVHRLVHMASRWWLKEHKETTNWTKKACFRLEEILPYGGHEKRDIWVNYIPHALFLAEPQNELRIAEQISLLSRVGSCQSSLGQYSVAAVTCRQTFKLQIEELGERHPNTLNSMNNLALALDRQGKYEEAEAMHRQTLELRKEILGERHSDTLTSMNNLAWVLDSQGKYEEAEAMHRQTLELRKEILGERHPDTLTSMNNLAWVLFRQGKYEEAEAMHRQTLESTKEILGERHPDTLTSMNNLALVLFRQGKYEEAEAMHRQTLELRKEILGERHPDTLNSMNNLALVLDLVLDSQGKYEEAEAMHRQTLESTKEILGERHPNTLTSMNNLAWVLFRQGKYEEAEAMHRQTLELTKEILGERHPDTLNSMNNLASVLFRQGKYEEAEAMHRQTLELRKEKLGERHPNTLTSMNNLAWVLDSQGKYEEAEAMHRQTLELRKEILGERHPDILTSMNNLAWVLDSQGKYEEAEKIRDKQEF